MIIGYVKVSLYVIFKDKGIPHEYAIIITLRMNKRDIATAPSFKAMKEVIRCYKNMARISNTVAKFLRQNGYAGYPGTAEGGLSL